MNMNKFMSSANIISFTISFPISLSCLIVLAKKFSTMLDRRKPSWNGSSLPMRMSLHIQMDKLPLCRLQPLNSEQQTF